MWNEFPTGYTAGWKEEGLAKSEVKSLGWITDKTYKTKIEKIIIIFDSMCSLAFSRLSGRGIEKKKMEKSRAIYGRIEYTFRWHVPRRNETKKHKEILKLNGKMRVHELAELSV